MEAIKNSTVICHLIFLQTYYILGVVHKLRLQYLSFFDHLPPSVYIFYGIKVYKKSIFLTSSCIHSLWSAPCGKKYIEVKFVNSTEKTLLGILPRFKNIYDWCGFLNVTTLLRYILTCFTLKVWKFDLYSSLTIP